MHVFKTRAFARWADGDGLADEALAFAVVEMEQGLIDAHLGGQVVKKRVALPGHGKRGGARTLVAFRQGEKAFFVYGFAKNERANISDKELKALKLLANELLNYPEASLTKAIKAGELIEIEVNENGN
ncbi:MAG: type II toxin-antitoxin system RelE/ParE family toxin [Gammaproteobacteria bacterium]|nr:type II toxin-antitoxin system RelE/ParE family toxin [Gammaproteobacteria bacterium]MDH5304755.1 type II toxin-antitoxin system RelE/ParE family toxin [Gammaproteobacteria bacterium]MDH5322768.1 type II toxin-antitoxin system RelE/ParE family toxin [Gammaproteobacteria bacterium]